MFGFSFHWTWTMISYKFKIKSEKYKSQTCKCVRIYIVPVLPTPLLCLYMHSNALDVMTVDQKVKQTTIQKQIGNTDDNQLITQRTASKIQLMPGFIHLDRNICCASFLLKFLPLFCHTFSHAVRIKKSHVKRQ